MEFFSFSVSSSSLVQLGQYYMTSVSAPQITQQTKVGMVFAF